MGGSRRRFRGGRRRPQMSLAWFDVPPTALGGQTTEDGRTLLVSAVNVMPQPTLQVDWGRKEVLRVVRIILKILMVLTSTGAENYVQVIYGVRIGELDDDDSLRTAADDPSLLLSANNHRRVDWLWRGSSAPCLVPATNGTEVAVLGDGGGPLSIDVKSNRTLGPREGLILHYRALALGSQVNCDAVQTSAVDGRILLGRRRAW